MVKGSPVPSYRGRYFYMKIESEGFKLCKLGDDSLGFLKMTRKVK